MQVDKIIVIFLENGKTQSQDEPAHCLVGLLIQLDISDNDYASTFPTSIRASSIPLGYYSHGERVEDIGHIHGR